MNQTAHKCCTSFPQVWACFYVHTFHGELLTAACDVSQKQTSSVEFQSEGTTLEDAKEMCRAYEGRGFDFVEFSGGTAENFLFNHDRESTKKQEAFFAEFAEQFLLEAQKICPVFKNTIVYLTGGFRTVGAVVDAVQRNTTQVIGLGRPITAEPDLPKKILNGVFPSAVKNEFNQNEMEKTIMASCSQIEQMGRKSVKTAGGSLMDQISDFTDGGLVAKYDKAVVEFMIELKKDLFSCFKFTSFRGIFFCDGLALYEMAASRTEHGKTS